MHSNLSPSRASSIAYILLATAFTTYSYIEIVLPRFDDVQPGMAAIMSGTALSPYVYRVLTPAVIIGLGNTFGAYILFHGVMFALFFTLLHLWLRRWRVNRLGIFVVAMMFPVMFEAWWFASYSITEVVLFLCGLLLLTRRSSSPARSTGN